MKIRTDFVTNSSSSSFIFKEDQTDEIQKHIKEKLWDKFVEYWELMPYSDDKEEEMYREYEMFLSWGGEYRLFRIKDFEESIVSEVYSWYREDCFKEWFPGYEDLENRIKSTWIRSIEEEAQIKTYMESLENGISEDIWTKIVASLLIELYCSNERIPMYARRWQHPYEEVEAWDVDRIEQVLLEYVSESWGRGCYFYEEFYYELTVENFQKVWETARKFANIPMGELLEYMLDAKYMYFDDGETHYILAELIGEVPGCRFWCSHMG